MDRFQFSSRFRKFLLPLLLTFPLFLVAQSGSANELDDLLEMPLSELLEMEVTSVSRREQNLLSASAAIYVITDEDLR
ncbi:MAG: hypothetical protein OQK12_18475, partial [Motiliproteus sp.]|nr:hypothetical protein [Motiliproteus sp.]